MNLIPKVILSAVTVFTACSLNACDTFSGSRDNSLSEPMSVAVRASNRDAAVGDTISIVSETRNLMSRDATIDWTTTGGTLEKGDDSRIARIRFDTPGVYTVTARALVNGVVVDTDSVEINVKELLPAQPMRESDLRDNRDLNDNRDDMDNRTDRGDINDLDRDRDLNNNGIPDRNENPRPRTPDIDDDIDDPRDPRAPQA